ncbi:MAG: LacI family transcriptional regulator [Gorillibacterium sp.]|nr:LacI family transcriptional regulator [Gorillibacterium sp.]
MKTFYDIAKATGFSPTTVSKVFNNYADVSVKTRNKILEAAREMDYMPNAHARTLTTKRSWTIGILFVEPTGFGLKHPFFGGVIEGFKKAAVTKGYDLMFISKDIGGKPNSYLQHCKMRAVEGVVVIQSDGEDPDFAELLDSSIPCVLLDAESPKSGTVCSDNEEGSLQAVRYLYGLGHRKIAHIAGEIGTFAGKPRKAGYERAMAELGLSQKPDYVVHASSDYSVDSGYKAMSKLLQATDRPTAVVAAGDNLAIGAMVAIRERGLRVPYDISLIGFDDIETARYVTPALTTVHQDMFLLGERAANMLIASIETGEELQVVKEPVELMIRDSCRKLEL